ncbi:hypothetical protein YV76_001773 [Salmonella enterica subsp. enterica]|nr:hypothetical protein [Salmonella enterica subsp. enterica]
MQLLTHRLIMHDRLRGVTDENTARVALGKVNQYLDDVNHQCESDGTDKGNAAFVSCASQIIAGHFYYTPSIEVSNNYAINRSDCDTNTYLLMDAASQHGIDSYIVYSPSHAFFAWKDSFGYFRYRETTSSNNKGGAVDLNEELYQKNFSRSYYTAFKGERVEDIYDTLIYGIAKIKPELDAIYKKYPDDAFVSDWYFYNRAVNNQLTKNDARELVNWLQADITSIDKRYALIHYFLALKDRNSALNEFQKINLDKCTEDCFQTGEQLNLISYKYSRVFFDWYSDALEGYGAKTYVGAFFNSLIVVAAGIISLIVAVTGAIILYFRREQLLVAMTDTGSVAGQNEAK